MSRSLTRILVVLVTALSLTTRAYAVTPSSAAGALLDSYGILALDELRTRGFTATTGNVGVNEGTLYSHGALKVLDGAAAASTVRLGDGSMCTKLIADAVVKATSACGPLPDMPTNGKLLGDIEPADACGFPATLPHCGGASITVAHGATRTLPPGTYSDALVEGGGAGAGTLILTGGKYVFCSLRVARYAKLLVRGPVEIDVAGDLAFSNLTTVGPAAASNVPVRDVKLNVGGSRLRFARKAVVGLKLCAPNGALFINDGVVFEGCALAKRIRTDRITVKGGCAPPPTTTTTTHPPTTTTLVSSTSTTSVTTSTSAPTTSSTSTSTSTTTASTVEPSTTVTSTSTSSSTVVPCGNGKVDPGEDCDGNVPGNVVCLDSAGGGILEAECPLCTNACKLDCSCCPSGQCATVTSTTEASTTSSTVQVPTTSSTTLTPTTSTSTSSSVVSTTTPPTTLVTTTSTTTTSTSIQTNTTIVTTTSSTTTSTSTSSTSTSTSTSTTSTSSSSTSTPPSTSTSTTTSTAPPTTLPPPQLLLNITAGTSNCGSAGLVTGPTAPLSGQLLDATNVKLADLGLGCLYFGGGGNTNVPGGIIPTGSTTFLNVTAQNGTALTLGGATGPSTSCSKGAGPSKHCVHGEAGTDTLGACTSDADCKGGTGVVFVGSCVLDANCFFGPPLSIPNPSNAGTSTCVINVIQNDVSGTGNSSTGAVNVALPLASRVFLTSTSYDDNTTTVIEACPRCINSKCNAGAKKNVACVTTAPNLTSVDCPPLANQFLATLPIVLSPFSTGPTSLANATGVFCPNQTTAPQNSNNAGAFGKKLTRTIQESGSPAGNLGDHAAHAANVASSFCIPKTGNALIDPVAGLPGPGALSIATTIKLTQ